MSKTAEQIRDEIRQRFIQLAARPDQEKAFPVGPASARQLGYDPQVIDSLPPSAIESFAGVGNPLSLGPLQPGDRVLDVGCGAGLDTLLAARQVGPSGQALGVDFLDEMIQKARKNAQVLGVANAEFLRGEADRLPLPAAAVDVVISNGVLNLCLDKPGVLAEFYRVLRPGGRLQLADILLEDRVTQEEVSRRGAWSD